MAEKNVKCNLRIQMHLNEIVVENNFNVMENILLALFVSFLALLTVLQKSVLDTNDDRVFTILRL